MTVIGLLIFLSACISPAPSFFLDSCAWNATHVLVATEGDEIDGKLMVLESWKGDLNPGDSISVPELAAFKPQESRVIKTPLFIRESKGPEKYVTCSRMILFLIKNNPSVPNEKSPPVVWSPAATAGFNVSVVWVEGDQTFAFIQETNPGPSLLTYYHAESESPIRSRVVELIHLQDKLNDTLAIPDCMSKAESLQQFAVSDHYFAQKAAFAELEKCGQSALPVLHRMLGDPSLAKLHGQVVKSLAKAGGNQVAEELTNLVRDEMAFWKATGPKLKKGWWNQLEEPEREKLQDRYSVVLQALRALKKLKYHGCKEAVTEFRDFWRSLPQLEDTSGLNQMSRECDEILRRLSQN